MGQDRHLICWACLRNRFLLIGPRDIGERRAVLRAVTIVLGAALMTPACGVFAAQVAITVRVVDAVTGAAVAQAQITVDTLHDQFIVVTDDHGQTTFAIDRDLPVGWQMTVTAIGYMSQLVPVEPVTRDSTLVVALTPRAAVTGS